MWQCRTPCAHVRASYVATPRALRTRARILCGNAARPAYACARPMWQCRTPCVHVRASHVAVPHTRRTRARVPCGSATHPAYACARPMWQCRTPCVHVRASHVAVPHTRRTRARVPCGSATHPAYACTPPASTVATPMRSCVPPRSTVPRLVLQPEVAENKRAGSCEPALHVVRCSSPDQSSLIDFLVFSRRAASFASYSAMQSPLSTMAQERYSLISMMTARIALPVGVFSYLPRLPPKPPR